MAELTLISIMAVALAMEPSAAELLVEEAAA